MTNPHPHAWTSLLIADMFQDGLEEQITDAVVLAPIEVVLFFGWQLLGERLPLDEVRDFGFHLGGPVNWAGSEAQVEMMVSTVQEGHQDITDTIIEKWTKAREQGHLWWTMKSSQTPTAAYNIKKWMQGLEEDASEADLRHNKMSDCETEQKNVHPYWLSGSRGWHRRQGAQQLPRDTSDGQVHSSGGGSSDQGSKWCSHPSTMTRGSRESNQAGRTERGWRVKVNLPIFKDNMTKDAVTYHSWWWDKAIFHCSGWDHQHVLSYAFQSFQGFPWRSSQEFGWECYLTWCLADVWWALRCSDDIWCP